MLLRFLGSVPVLIAVWILGPLALFLIARHNKRRRAAEMAQAAAGKAAAAPPKKDRDTSAGVTPVPMVPMDITPGFRDLKWGDAPPETM